MKDNPDDVCKTRVVNNLREEFKYFVSADELSFSLIYLQSLQRRSLLDLINGFAGETSSISTESCSQAQDSILQSDSQTFCSAIDRCSFEPSCQSEKLDTHNHPLRSDITELEAQIQFLQAQNQQLKEQNQQLVSRNQQLDSRNQQLEARDQVVFHVATQTADAEDSHGLMPLNDVQMLPSQFPGSSKNSESVCMQDTTEPEQHEHHEHHLEAPERESHQILPSTYTTQPSSVLDSAPSEHPQNTKNSEMAAHGTNKPPRPVHCAAYKYLPIEPLKAWHV